jgi:hypothetical protein
MKAKMTIRDTTGQPRSDKDLLEAKQAMVNELISMKNFGPMLIYYPTLIEAVDELLKRRKIDEQIRKK